MIWLKGWRRAHPHKFCRAAAGIFNIMISVRTEIKTFSGFHGICLVAKVQTDSSRNHISELLALMRLILLQFLLWLNHHKQRFHLILLRIRHNPLNAVSGFINFFKKCAFLIHHMFFFRLLEKFRRCRSQTFDEIQQCHHRRCHLTTL